jgi:hypothetical protein
VGARRNRQRTASLVHEIRGTLYDRRWLPVVEELYGWHYRNERYLRNERPLARVGLVYSQQTAQFMAARRGKRWRTTRWGYYQALIEARIPFEMVHDQLLDAEHTAKLQALIFPNIAALPNAQCEQIRAYRGARRRHRGHA